MKAVDFKFDRSLIYVYQVLSQGEIEDLQSFVQDHEGYESRDQFIHSETLEKALKIEEFFRAYQDMKIVSTHADDYDKTEEDSDLEYDISGYNYMRVFRVDSDVAFMFFFKEQGEDREPFIDQYN